MDHQVTESVNLIFLGGSGRSGTNITRQIFSYHSQVATLPFEYRFIIDPCGVVDFYNSITHSWSPFVSDHKIHHLVQFLRRLSKRNPLRYYIGLILKELDKNGKLITPPQYHEWELAKWLPFFNKHIDLLVEELVDFNYNGYWPGSPSYSIKNQVLFSAFKSREEIARPLGDFIRRCIIEYLRLNQKSCFLEDNTWNILYARELLELVPEAKILHIYRDPRDVVASLLKQRWCPSDLKKAITLYRSIMQRWFCVRQELQPKSYVEFRLEDLVADARNTLGMLCDFLGLNFELNMLKTDLSKSNQGCWRKEFINSEQKILEDELSDILETLRY